MKITHEELLPLLAKALNMNQQEAEKALEEWSRQKKSEFLQKGSVKIAGLGEITMGGDGLVFSPEERLAIEVNYKYAGMKPLEISPPASVSSLEKESSPGEEHAEPPAGETVSSAASGHLEEEPPADKTVPSATSGRLEEESPAGETVPSVASGPLEEESPAGETVPSAASGPLEEDLPLDRPVLDKHQSEPERATESKIKEKVQSPTGKSAREKKKVASWIWLVPMAGAVLVALMLFFHFQGQMIDRRYSPEPLPIPEPVVPESPPQHALSSAEPEAPGVYGLRGPVEELLRGSYTIVLYSVVNADRARVQKELFEQAGYKATLWEVDFPDGRKKWRIGVGQFETVSHAERAAAELPEPYQSDHFIIRIR